MEQFVRAKVAIRQLADETDLRAILLAFIGMVTSRGICETGEIVELAKFVKEQHPSIDHIKQVQYLTEQLGLLNGSSLEHEVKIDELEKKMNIVGKIDTIMREIEALHKKMEKKGDEEHGEKKDGE